MFKSFKRIILEAKLRLYAEMFEYYKHKVLKQKYYTKKLNEYNDKIYETEEKYIKLTEH